MSVWLIVLLCIAGFFLADAVLRQFMPNLLHFATIPGTGDSKHLIVFLPGILADGDVSSREVRESWLAKAGTLLTVDYGHQRFDSRRVVGNVARQISFSHGAGGSYGRVTIIGASMGGKLGAKLIGQLRNVYQWQPEDLTLIAVDTPTSPDDFAGPGKILSWILSKIYAGPLLSWLLMWPLRLALVLPKDENIEQVPGVAFAATCARVKQLAKARMSAFWFSANCDQQRCLQREPFDWPALLDVRVIYQVCIRDNETVIQPQAVETWQVHVPQTERRDVDSTHCGFLERPETWEEAYATALGSLG